ncbi:MAG: EAL domain-containing protein [Lachnospiraceae bacterium]|nr:EAL domain-containing protein [Lachnospiraceae bacterium]
MNVTSQLCALVILMVVFIFFITSKPLKLPTTIAFYIMLFTTMGMVVTDIVSIYFLNNLDEISRLGMTVLAKSYLFFLNATVFSAMYYIYADVYGNTEKRRKIAFSKAIIFILADIVMIFSPVYWYSSAHIVYTHGPGIQVTYVICIYGMAVICALVFKGKELMSTRRRYAIALWIYVWLTASAVQFVVPTKLIVTFAGVLGVLIVYIMLENPDAKIDRRTGLLNMKAFEGYLRKLFELKKKFSVYVIVADELSDLKEDNKKNVTSRQLDKFIGSIKSLKKSKIFFDGDDQMVVIFEDSEHGIYDKKVFESHIEEAGRDGFDLYGMAKYFYIPDAIFTDSVYYFEKIIRYARQNNNDVLAKDKIVIDGDMYKKMMEEIETEELLLEALENDRVEMYYQPIYSTVKQKFTSVEALVRIKDREGKIVPPIKFISVAEENGMIIKLGEVIFEKVCKFIGGEDYPKLGLEYVEINLSVVQCCYAKLARDFIDIMDKYSVNPKSINLEITESASIEGKNILLKNMEKLRNYGVKFSLDDFGTGQSNLNYIAEMPVDIVKFDRDMTRSYFENDKAHYVMGAAMSMIKGMEMEIVSEGIETSEQYKTMKGLGIDYIQGYYFSKPLPEKEFIEFMLKANGNE